MSEPFRYVFTIFTPTYNRADTLPRVWESLKAQTFRDFEWLIVDDGSTDNTRELVAGYAAEAPFPIRYLWQHNQHKKTAYNYAVREAQGELMISFDSDDACVPEALERLHWHWLNIPEDQRHRYSAVTVLCKGEDGKIVGDRFPGGDWIDSTCAEMCHRWRVTGEKWGFHRTTTMRAFPFPEDVQGNVPEAVVWMAIDKKFLTRYVNEVLRVYYVGAGDSTITISRANPAKLADGGLLGYGVELRECSRFFLHNPVGLAKVAALMVRLALHSRLPLARRWQWLWQEQSWFGRLLLFVTAPVGFAYWAMDRLRRS
jgi:glycosyltransferase involved in cell wall biosynthesis